jgi:hypothetical protein
MVGCHYSFRRERTGPPIKGETSMTKLMSVLLGLSLAMGAVSVGFADDTTGTKKETKKNKKKKTTPPTTDVKKPS